MLKVTDLKVKYGMIEAIKGISFEVRDGEIVTMIGANGAGKTTTMHAISGLVKAAEGSIMLDNTELTKTPANKIVGLGLAQVPEGRRVFAEQTVEENLILGAYLRKDKDAIRKDMEEVYQLFPRLKERRTQLAGTLSGGEQQMLAMGRALMAKPSILLLDEPSMGLSPLLVSEIFHIIEEINDKGTTILLVEQNAKRALAIADRAYVLETGTISLEKRVCRLFDTLVQAMGGIVYAAEKKEIAVSVDCPEYLTLSHDSKWTAEALFNLLDNAVKYTPEGGSISVSVVAWELYVEIKVTDTGKGISESNQAAIFRRFYREEEVHDQQGVGIGLYLAREIVTRQGGYIKVISEPGQGSAFSIMLPVE